MEQGIQCNYAIIIVNYMNYEVTMECVDNLRQIIDNPKIVVVDNASTNESYDALFKKYQSNESIYVILSEENGGYSKGNNLGIKFAEKVFPKLEYIVIMNPDVILLSKKTIEDNIRILQNNEDIGVATSVMFQNNKPDLYNTGWQIPSLLDLLCSDLFVIGRVRSTYKKQQIFCEKNGIRIVECVHGSFFVIDKKLWDSFGGFDENVFLYYEENIIGKLIKNTGKVACINLNDSYLHNHNYTMMTLKQAQKSAKIRKKSQSYFARYYLHASPFMMVVLQISYSFYIYVELPIVKALSRLKRLV